MLEIPIFRGIPLRARESSSNIPLTASQLQLWNCFERYNSGRSFRMCTTSVRLLGTLNVSSLAAAIGMVVQNHESLRTRVVAADGIPSQCIDPPVPFELDVVDLAHLSVDVASAEVERRANDLALEKFDLSEGPLFTAELYRLSAREHILVCALDHMISDAASLGILDEQIWSLYLDGIQGKMTATSPPPIQFADYVIWQRSLREIWLNTHGTYWLKHLRDVPALALERFAVDTIPERETGNIFRLSFGAQRSEALRATAIRERVSLPIMICAIHVAVMLRWCRQEEARVLFITDGRFFPKVRRMVGWVARPLNLRIHLGAHDSFQLLLSRLKSELNAAMEHADFEWVPELLPHLSTDAAIGFNWMPAYAGNGVRPTLPQSIEGSELIQIEPFFFRPKFRVPFAPIFSEVDDEIYITVHHLPSRFSDDVVKTFVSNILLFADDLLHDIQTRVSGYRYDISSVNED